MSSPLFRSRTSIVNASGPAAMRARAVALSRKVTVVARCPRLKVARAPPTAVGAGPSGANARTTARPGVAAVTRSVSLPVRAARDNCAALGVFRRKLGLGAAGFLPRGSTGPEVCGAGIVVSGAGVTEQSPSSHDSGGEGFGRKPPPTRTS